MPLKFVVFICLLLQVLFAHASPWNVGLKGGFGGTGIKKTVDLDQGNVDASRSEGPGVIGISLEKVVSDRWSLAIEHRRGFRFGPFSSGVGFTDVTYRWFYMAAAPALVLKSSDSYIFTKKWVPFLGFSSGIAFGSIHREGDKVSSVDSSGIIMGTKLGIDYHYKSNMILRPEVIVSSTFMNSGNVPSSMSEFGLMFGALFHY
ncbi:MAG: hypothetical protein H6625_03180 [Bdellovibrionaceae bacterium]|nr:hypothetical protein [Pseudobdellovibrionaceae bacterium]